MRKVIFLILLLNIIILSYLTSCERYGQRYEYFIVNVDSLYPVISHEDTLHINLYGPIGPDGCYSFSHFEAKRDSFNLNLTVYGKRDIQAFICPQIAVYLDTFYSVYTLYPGSFFIEIEQPNGSVLKDTVIVE